MERLSGDELIELALRLRQPAKTSRASSKPPSTDRKARREQAKPGGAKKPGHEGHSRTPSTNPGRVIDHAPQRRPCCCLALSPDLPSEAVSVHERIELPEIKPVIRPGAAPAQALARRSLRAGGRRLAPGCRPTVAAKRGALERRLNAI